MRYHTIVADPPWDHSDGTGWNPGVLWKPSKPATNGQLSGHGEPRVTAPPYPCMSVERIKELPVKELAAANSHLYLWTTQRYLRDSFDVVEAWGFKVSATLTWCKKPRGFMGGAYRSSTEFCHFAKRGSLAHQIQAPTRWFTWPRVGSGSAAGGTAKQGHSRKPDAFLDMVEQVSPGPYLELFARRRRLGWDCWGNEVESDVELIA